MTVPIPEQHIPTTPADWRVESRAALVSREYASRRRPYNTIAADVRKAWRVALARPYRSIKEFAEALIQLVAFRDVDGRAIGFEYTYIRDAILRRFPTVPLRTGPHAGKPTIMQWKELQNYASDLNREGARLPFRPRRLTTLKPGLRRRRRPVSPENESPASQPPAVAALSEHSAPSCPDPAKRMDGLFCDLLD